MLKFYRKRPFYLCVHCQNMECGNRLKWNRFLKIGWTWCWQGEDFCSYKCKEVRKRVHRLRHMYYSGGIWDWKSWREVQGYRLNYWLNPLEWLKRW